MGLRRKAVARVIVRDRAGGASGIDAARLKPLAGSVYDSPTARLRAGMPKIAQRSLWNFGHIAKTKDGYFFSIAAKPINAPAAPVAAVRIAATTFKRNSQ